MRKKNIFTGNYDSFVREDYPMLREHFLNVFMKGTYKKISYHEKYSSGPFGTFDYDKPGTMTQPRVRRRYLLEAGYKGKYQPKSVHTREADKYRMSMPEAHSYMVIGRYYTKNFEYKHNRAQILFLSGSKKGKIGYVTAG